MTIATFGLIPICLVPLGPNEPGLLELAVSGNRSALETIHSYYAEIERTSTQFSTTSTLRSRYWRHGFAIRILEQAESGLTTDLSIDSEKSRCVMAGVSSKPPTQQVGMVIGSKDRRWVETDAWELSLFDLPVGLNHPQVPIPRYSLAEAVRQGMVSIQEWTEFEGHRVAHFLLKIPGVSRSYEVWVDPQVNWLIRKCVHELIPEGSEETGGFRLEYRVTSFAETGPGVFVPERVEVSSWIKSQPSGTATVAFKNIRVNEPLPPQPAVMIPPEGLIVLDEIEGRQYRLDIQGRRVGPFSQSRGIVVPLASPLQTDATEPFWLRHIAWLLIAIAMLVAIMGYVKYRVSLRK